MTGIIDTAPAAAAPMMDIFTAITERRSVGRVRQDAVPRETIERLIEAATGAPNHHLTEPWRFIVITGRAREAFGAAMGTAQAAELDPATDPARVAERIAKASAKAPRAPVIVAVAVEPVAKYPGIEEITAGAAAIQNLLFAAHAHGLGAIWRTGGPAYAPAVRTYLGIAESATILGFIYLGWPDGETPTKSRHPAAQFARWLTDEQ